MRGTEVVPCPSSSTGKSGSLGKHQPFHLPFPRVISLCLFCKSFYLSSKLRGRANIISFPMSSWIHSLLSSSKMSLFMVLNIFYSEKTDIYLRPFKQSVLNTELYFDFLWWKKCWVHLLVSSNSDLAVSLNVILYFFPFEIFVLSQSNQYTSQWVDILGFGLNILMNSSSADMRSVWKTSSHC